MTLHVRGRVRNRRLVIDEPVDLPEGTELDLVASILVRRKPGRRFGSMAGKIAIAPDFDAPLADFDEYT